MAVGATVIAVEDVVDEPPAPLLIKLLGRLQVLPPVLTTTPLSVSLRMDNLSESLQSCRRDSAAISSAMAGSPPPPGADVVVGGLTDSCWCMAQAKHIAWKQGSRTGCT